MTLAEELDAMEASGDPAKVAIAGYARRYQSAAAIVEAAERTTRDDPYESFEGNGDACRFCFNRRNESHKVTCLWEITRDALAAAGRPHAENT